MMMHGSANVKSTRCSYYLYAVIVLIAIPAAFIITYIVLYISYNITARIMLLVSGGMNVEWLVNPLKPELNPICYLLALLGAHHFLHVSRIRVKLLTFRRLMS